MSCWVNPIPLTLVPTQESESFRHMPVGSTGLPLEQHPGAFGVVRKHHVHEGIDLYCERGTPVYAVEDGIVVSILHFTGSRAEPPSPWWHDTMAVMIEGQTGVVLYGEIVPVEDLRVNDLIKGGAMIGFVAPVLKTNKGRPTSMLHMELHRSGTRDALEWSVDGIRPNSLRDPTAFLEQIAQKNS